ncbi:hypothetical protein DRJ22_00170 [Candidatus Woesearchaeota archaeon]|nr:MAG: hypothetical protein DRJ22_00170 [Candidatus Woesearchaeota archaeon]
MVKKLPEPEDLVEVVNKLLSQSFGEGFLGNSDLKSSIYKSEVIYYSELRKIIKFDVSSGNIFFAGRFSASDGSALQVIAAFEDSAKEYVKLYEKEFGRPASYEVIE